MTHITEVQNLASEIADVGEKLSEVTIMAKVLDSLTCRKIVLFKPRGTV